MNIEDYINTLKKIDSKESIPNKEVAPKMPSSTLDYIKEGKQQTPPKKPIKKQETIVDPNDPLNTFLIGLSKKLEQNISSNNKIKKEEVKKETVPKVSKKPKIKEEDKQFKEATLSFINSLKEKDEEKEFKQETLSLINTLKTKEEPVEIEEIKEEKVPEKDLQEDTNSVISKEETPLPPKAESEVVESVQNYEQPEDAYVDELKKIESSEEKDEDSSLNSNIKAYILNQIKEHISKNKNLNRDYITGGGGGSNAVQYARGGKMDGNLTVTGYISSGSVFYGDGAGLINVGSDEVTSIVESSSANWDYAYDVSTAYSIASSTFLTSETDSQVLSFDNVTKDLSISNGNSVSLSTLNDREYISTNYLPLSGGTLTGNLSSLGSVFVDRSLEVGTGTTVLYVEGTKVGINTETPNEQLTVVGDISATGNLTIGTGTTVLYANDTKVGINTETPTEELTVVGDISASGVIYADGGNSVQWSEVFTSYSAASSTFLTSETDSQVLSFDDTTKELSISNGNSVSLHSLSNNDYLPLSGGTITGNLSSLNSIYIDGDLEVGEGSVSFFVESSRVGVNTETPNKELTVVGDISSTGDLYANNGDSIQWNEAYTNVQSNSSNWNKIPISDPLKFTFIGDNSTTEYSVFGTNSSTNASYIEVFVENVRQNPYVSYTLNSDVVRFTEPPDTGAVIVIITPNTKLLNVETSEYSVMNTFPVKSVANKTGDVLLEMSDIENLNTSLTSTNVTTSVINVQLPAGVSFGSYTNGSVIPANTPFETILRNMLTSNN